jgi:hypothetical protein
LLESPRPGKESNYQVSGVPGDGTQPVNLVLNQLVEQDAKLVTSWLRTPPGLFPVETTTTVERYPGVNQRFLPGEKKGASAEPSLALNG